jgi:hypothetical protein
MAADDREDLADGVEHLQAAAKEMIRATRSLLDAAEGLVEDPAALQGLLGTLGSLASAAAGRFRTAGAGAGGAGDDGEDDGKVQRIKLS